MSIIHEALKKVQSQRTESSVFDSVPAASEKINSPALPLSRAETRSEVNHQSAKKPVPGLSILWITLAIILAGAAAYYLRESRLLNENTPPLKNYPETAIPVKTPEAKSENSDQGKTGHLSGPSAQAPKEILLSGIVVMDGKKFALVNNNYYETGESVSGATITRITADSIDIIQDGRASTLKVLTAR